MKQAGHGQGITIYAIAQKVKRALTSDSTFGTDEALLPDNSDSEIEASFD